MIYFLRIQNDLAVLLQQILAIKINLQVLCSVLLLMFFLNYFHSYYYYYFLSQINKGIQIDYKMEQQQRPSQQTYTSTAGEQESSALAVQTLLAESNQEASPHHERHDSFDIIKKSVYKDERQSKQQAISTQNKKKTKESRNNSNGTVNSFDVSDSKNQLMLAQILSKSSSKKSNKIKNLNPLMSIVETSPTGATNTPQEANAKWRNSLMVNPMRTDNTDDDHRIKLPVKKVINKVQSVEQMHVRKEQQKIIEFFAQQESEDDANNIMSSKKIFDKKTQHQQHNKNIKLPPMGKKNLRNPGYDKKYSAENGPLTQSTTNARSKPPSSKKASAGLQSIELQQRNQQLKSHTNQKSTFSLHDSSLFSEVPIKSKQYKMDLPTPTHASESQQQQSISQQKQNLSKLSQAHYHSINMKQAQRQSSRDKFKQFIGVNYKNPSQSNNDTNEPVKNAKQTYKHFLGDRNTMMQGGQSKHTQSAVSLNQNYQQLMTMGQGSNSNATAAEGPIIENSYDFKVHPYNASSQLGHQNSMDSLLHQGLMKANQRKFQVRSQLQNHFQQGQDNVSLNVKVNLKTPKKQKMPPGHDYDEYESTTLVDLSREQIMRQRNKNNPNSVFNYNQIKIQKAIKVQQIKQSRQYVNDHILVLPEMMSESYHALREGYKKNFQASTNMAIGRKSPFKHDNVKTAAIKGEDTQYSNSKSGGNYMMKQSQSVSVLPNLTFMNPQPSQHDVLDNLSQVQKDNITVLLNDQYSSHRANHLPGEEDPLDQVKADYEDKTASKNKRFTAQLASLKVKRRTKFQAIPVKRSQSRNQDGESIYSPKRDQDLVENPDPDQQAYRALRHYVSQGNMTGRGAQSTDNSRNNQNAGSSSNNQFDFKKTRVNQAMRFDAFRGKIQQMYQEQGYMSESGNSEEAEEQFIELIEKHDKRDKAEENFEFFWKKSVKWQKEGFVSLLSIIKKSAKFRDPEDRDHLIAYLKFSVPFFREMSRELIRTLVDKLEYRIFNKGESMMDQGDVGDSMFIVYSGEYGVYIFDKKMIGVGQQQTSHRAVATIGANTVVGQSAVIDPYDSGKRNATVLAHTDVVTLILTKADYQKILYQYTIQEKQKRFEFLGKIPFFSKFDRVSLVDFNNACQDLRLTQGSTLYDIGQDPSTFYVVRKGKLIMETIIETDSFFRYPIDKQKWEVRKKSRRICYKLQDMWKGSYFGHEEIIQGYNRRCKVRCVTECQLIYINGAEILSWRPERIEELKRTMRVLDLDYIVDKINRFQKEKTKRNVALLDASKLNCYEMTGDRSHFLHDSDKRHMDKMLPWINKARSNSTQDLKLLHELKKVTYLSQKEEKYILNKGEDDLDQILEKRHARFITPEDALTKNVVNEVYIKELSKKRKSKREPSEQIESQNDASTTSISAGKGDKN